MFISILNSGGQNTEPERKLVASDKDEVFVSQERDLFVVAREGFEDVLWGKLSTGKACELTRVYDPRVQGRSLGYEGGLRIEKSDVSIKLSDPKGRHAELFKVNESDRSKLSLSRSVLPPSDKREIIKIMLLKEESFLWPPNSYLIVDSPGYPSFRDLRGNNSRFRAYLGTSGGPLRELPIIRHFFPLRGDFSICAKIGSSKGVFSFPNPKNTRIRDDKLESKNTEQTKKPRFLAYEADKTRVAKGYAEALNVTGHENLVRSLGFDVVEDTGPRLPDLSV